MSNESPAKSTARSALPAVHGERCVHSALAQANCRACVDACPTAAWVIDDDALGIDAARCDGCGLCVPACPEGAIVSTHVESAMREARAPVALFACDRAQVEPGKTQVPCLHALGVSELLRLYRVGVRRLNVACGDCDTCPRTAASTLQDRVAHLNRLFANRGLQRMQARVVSAAQWKRITEDDGRGPKGPVLSRRSFFRRAVRSSIDMGMDIAGIEREPGFVPPGRLLPRSSPDQVVPCVPRIDPGRCTACGACVSLCPHQALADTDTGYRLDAEACTGCAICADACDRGAVDIDYWQPQTQFVLPLQAHRCRACGATFRAAAPGEAPGEYCFICAGTNHARNLFQVLD